MLIGSQLALALVFAAIILATVFVIPGDAIAADHWSFGNAAQIAVAFSDASLGTIVFSTNVVLSAIAAVQGIAFAAAAALFLRHWAIIILSSEEGMTFAALDFVLQNNYLQLVRHFWLKPTVQIAFIGFVSLFSLIFVRIIDLLVQSAVIDSYGYYPGTSQISYPNTSAITGNLISFSQDGGAYLETPTVSSSLFQSFSESMLAVSKDCSNGICGANTNSSTVLIDCVGKSMNCTAQIPIYTDYLMTCSQRLETSSTAILDSDISVLIDPANVTVNGSVPSVTWDVKITDTSNVNTTLIVNCTIFAAWATRTENSESGTLDKQLVTVYDSVAAATDPSTRDSNSFNYQANCGKLAAPLCQLYILGQVMNAPWNGINTVSGFASWGLNMLSIPVLKNTTASSNQKAADLEASMRFFVEDIMRRIILSATADPDVITCTGCAFRDARGTQKGLVIAFVVIVSGAGALLMAISIAWTYTKHTVQQHINSIDIAQLPIVSKNVREQVLESLKPNDDVQFSANIGIRPDGPADEEEVPDADVAVGLASGNSRAESLTESHLRRKTFVGSLQRRSLLGVPESTNSRLSVIGSIKE